MLHACIRINYCQTMLRGRLRSVSSGMCSERDAQAALDLRNSRYNRRLQALMEAEQAAAAAASMSGSGSISVGSPIERFNQVQGEPISC